MKIKSTQKDPKSLGLIIKLFSSSLKVFIPARQRELPSEFKESKTAQTFRKKEFISPPVISNTMSLSICLLRSSNSWNRNSSTVIGEHRPCDYFISRKSQILYLLCAFKWHRVNQSWLKSFKEEAKICFSFTFLQMVWLCNHTPAESGLCC